ncbi:MAG: ABC transporter ATP-binding protein [Candidatus Cloacimonetes bacterium]|nr:ABC transporter ATP-binding protein [Candidatus Cloacimonadota bacterium]MDD2507300.1 ABC transporter ATP-binding protein [Candidatus Cloacimonadota bacterium]MDD4560615.1 ABC transporter ATP-binding protein [Candidatus Cloacimonadota bacterium]
MIKLTNLSKIYRTDTVETTALNDLNLTIEKGSFIAIKGPSGCGKTTLLNILGLMDRASRGEYSFTGKNASTMSENERNRLRRKTIGFLFQKFNLISSLTVFENVELPLLYQKVNTSSRKERVMSILGQLGVEARKDHFPHQLSGGQQQRVSLARCVINNPELILADEPTGNLDSRNGEEVMRLLKDLHTSGRTIVMVTHDDHYATFADQIIHLNDGMIV